MTVLHKHSEPEDNGFPEDIDDEEEAQPVLGRKPLQYSRAYKRFFEGWEEHEVMVAPGKYRSERVYVADYYTIRGGLRRKCGLGACYIVLMAGILMCFIFASTQDAVFNRTWYGAVTQALSLAGWLWMLAAVLSWIIASLKMTLGELRGGPKALLRSTFAGIVVNVLAAAVSLLQIALSAGECVGQQIMFAAVYLGCAAMALLMRALEKSNEYVVTQ